MKKEYNNKYSVDFLFKEILPILRQFKNRRQLSKKFDFINAFPTSENQNFDRNFRKIKILMQRQVHWRRFCHHVGPPHRRSHRSSHAVFHCVPQRSGDQTLVGRQTTSVAAVVRIFPSNFNFSKFSNHAEMFE